MALSLQRDAFSLFKIQCMTGNAILQISKPQSKQCGQFLYFLQMGAQTPGHIIKEDIDFDP